jgi:hypothetical protein
LPEDIDFEETFDADVGAWEFRDDPGVTVPGRWTYAGGDLVQDADVAGPDEVGPALGTHAIGGDPDWDAYVVEVSYEVDDDGVVGVSCHVGGPGDWTRLELDHDDGWARLLRSDGGTVVVLDEFQVLTPPVALGVEHLLSLECGTTYRGFVDAVAYLQAPGDAEREGAVGMFASQTGEGVTGVRFHWIEVSDDVE